MLNKKATKKSSPKK
jgi:DNA-binding protein HU-beta